MNHGLGDSLHFNYYHRDNSYRVPHISMYNYLFTENKTQLQTLFGTFKG